MNTFNRVAMILILLGVIGSIAIGLLVLLLYPASMLGMLNNLSTRIAAGPGDRRLQELQLELTVIGLIVFVPSVVLLLLELRRPVRNSIRISNVSGSEAHLSMQAVAQSLIYYVDALPGVIRVRPRLEASKKSVDVRLDVETAPDVDVRTKTAEITQTTRQVIEERLGLKLNRLHIHIHHATYPPAALQRPLRPDTPRAPSASPPVVAGDSRPASIEKENPLS